MKSWADHSDSEDEGYIAPPPVNEDKEDNDEKSLHSEEEEFPKKEYVLPQEPPFTAFIGNLAPAVEEQDIVELVKQYGTVDSVRILLDRETGHKKGFGYIEMETVADVRTVICYIWHV